MIGYFYLILAFILNASGTVLVKLHAVRGGFSMEGNPLSNPLAIVLKNSTFVFALVLFALNLVCYDLALKRLHLSVAYPVMTVASFLLVILFSTLYFKESITWISVVGYILILSGILLVVTFAKP